MKQLLANPTVRLAGRALVAGGIAALTLYKQSGGAIAWKSLAVAAGLAFAEYFTPLNAIVGIFKAPPVKNGSAKKP